MWTPDADQAPPHPTAGRATTPTPAERLRANREIQRRGLCPHDGYSGTDPISGVVLCPICRSTGKHTPAYLAHRRPTPRPGTARGAILLDLANAMLPCLMFVAAISYTAWANWWI